MFIIIEFMVIVTISDIVKCKFFPLSRSNGGDYNGENVNIDTIKERE